MKNRRRTYKKRSAYRKRRQNLSRRSKGGFLGYDGIPFFSKKTASQVVQSNSNDNFGVSGDDMRLSERPTNDWSQQEPDFYSSGDERNAEYGYPEDLEDESQYPRETPAMGGRRTRRRHRNRRGSYKRRR